MFTAATKPDRRVRVLVVDDSYLWATTLSEVLAEDPDIEVLDIASDGSQAISATQELRPDLVIMDIQMPVVGGMEAISTIMAQSPTPILAMSATVGKAAGPLTFESLRRGALDLMVKDTTYPPPEEFSTALRSRVKELANVQVVRHLHPRRGVMKALRTPVASARIDVVAMAASTGGPLALATILQNLPPDFAVGILVVQHLMGGFAPVLAGWLNELTPLDVQVACQGHVLRPGQVLIAPDDRHLELRPDGTMSVNSRSPRAGNRPSADVLLSSVAETHGANALGLVLSGMGNDGAQGLKALRQAGGRTFAQDERTSVVFGMPSAAVAAMAVEELIPLPEIPGMLTRLVMDRRPVTAAS